MKEIQVVMSDDLIYTETGRRVPADETVTIALDGKTRELDLTAEHAKELRELMADWMEAGNEPRPESAPPATGRKSTAGRSLKNGKERMAKLRVWVDENHVRGLSGPDRPAYLTTTGKHYSPDWLLKAYAQAMVERGEHDEWIDKWASK